MSKSKILQEAMADAQELKKAAIQNAHNILSESIKPKIKEFIDSQLGEVELEAGDDEGNDEEDKIEVPEVEEMFTQPMENFGMTEVEDEEEKEDEPKQEDGEMDFENLRLGEAEDKEEEKEEEEEVDEVVEFTSEDLQKALAEVIKEATVTKGFGDAQDATIKASGGKGEKGIADEKAGEHQWIEETPPAKEDWTIKESKYRKLVNVLSGELKEYKEVCVFLKKQLKEVNLFNNKLLYTQKVLQSSNLNDKQVKTVIEMFDKAKTVNEVNLVYKTLSEGFKIAGVVSEGRKFGRNAKASSFTTSSSSLLTEAKQENSGNVWADRMKVLAGIIK